MSELKLYNLKDAAIILGLTVRTLYSYIKSGKLKAVKFGKEWRVTAAALEDFISTGTGKSGE